MLDVVSRDGTRIAFEKHGNGPPLILIGGALADHRFYVPLAAELADRFTVYNFDRRSRGQSADTRPYTVQREVEDVAALVADADEQVFLYGHSAGCAVALRAAAAGLDVAALALIDPPYTPRGEGDDAAIAAFAEEAAWIQELHDRGDHSGSAVYFLGGLGLPPESAKDLLRSPDAEGLIDCARALPYDYAQLGDGMVPGEIAAAVRVPTTVLAAESMSDAARQIAAVIPNGRYVALRAHAHELEPAEIAGELVRHLGRPSQPPA